MTTAAWTMTPTGDRFRYLDTDTLQIAIDGLENHPVAEAAFYSLVDAGSARRVRPRLYNVTPGAEAAVLAALGLG